MKKLGTRLISAALAACMMASVLPVSAFATGGGGTESESGVSEQAEAEVLPLTGKEITTGGTYEMQAGTYTGGFTINTTDDVTINITGDVEYTGVVHFITVSNAGTLTINGAVNGLNCKVTSEKDKIFFLMMPNELSSVATVNVNGGDYEWNVVGTEFKDGNPFEVCSGTLNLKNVTAASISKVLINRKGTVHIIGGTYIGKSSAYPALWNYGTMVLDEANVISERYCGLHNDSNGSVTINGGDYKGTEAPALRNYGTMGINGATVNAPNGNAVNNQGGRVTIDGGSYTSTKYITVYTAAGATTTVNDGTFNWSAGESDLYRQVFANEGTLYFNKGAVNATADGAGFATKTNADAHTEIKNCVIKGGNHGVEALGGTTVLGDVTFEDNTEDIYLASGQTITIKDTFTGRATVKVEDPAEGRVITTDTAQNQDKLDLISNDLDNTGRNYVVAYDSKNNDLVLRKGYRITTIDATAKTEQKKLGSPETVVADTRITATPVEKPGWRFTGWTAEGIELEDETAVTQTFAMPDHDVTLTAHYEEATEPGPSDPGDIDTPSDGSGIAGAIVTGGALAWGAYEAGTGIYRTVNMRGIPLPSDRAELALLIWEKADKPEPESAELYSDIDEDDTDLQKAARWMVEQELMKDQDDRFWPDIHVSKLRVCTTWEQAKQKGLIQ